MTAQTVVLELQNLGYTLYLEGDQLRYKCLSLIEPPKDRVIPLLEVIKRNREAVIDYLKPKNNPIPFETLKSLYLEAFNRIGWTQGLMARTEVIKAEDRLNEVWLECMEGRASLEDFKQTLNEWELTISKVTRLIGGNYGR